MCGILGQLSYSQQIDSAKIIAMTRMLKHRGPDDEGFYFSRTGGLPAVGLGHRRLSVIDLSPNGHQPMSNEDNQLWIVFNGEIYNFQDLRSTLVKKGHIFKSDTDTETILHLYEEYGVGCLQFLRGMFAFAIWDERQQRLFAARDRLGKKPLYYTMSPEGLYFASEINPLYEIDTLKKEINYSAIDFFLTYSYIPSPISIIKGINKLPPANYLIVEKDHITIERYWRPSFAPKLEVSYQEAQSLLLKKIEEATQIRLYSDVPLGCFLSGGVDSSLVLATMAGLSSKPVKTFSIGFPDKAFDETKYARVVAKRYQTDHREFTVKPEAVEILPQLIDHYGEPFGDASALPTWYLSELTRKYVTVALNGDGGDELFAGYNWYASGIELSRLSHFLPRQLVEQVTRKTQRFERKMGIGRKAYRLLELLAKDNASRFANLRAQIPGTVKQWLYSPILRQLVRQEADAYLTSLYYDNDASDELDRMLYVDTVTYLPEELLVKVDRAMMAHSLEGRSPLLDHELLELAACLPSEFKYCNGKKKRIVKAAAEKLFPPGFLDRPKAGFSVPLRRWFSTGLETYAVTRICNGPLQEMNLFDLDFVKQIISENKSGRRDHGELIWKLLVLSEWFRRFF